jgi:DHA3 family macrolide efflux protein-like MFS transporter
MDFINNKNTWKRQAVLFLISQNISMFGSSVVGFAIMWHITLTTSSGIWMMLATICAMLPQVLVSLFGGVLADRHNRKYLIMLSDGFIAFATLGLALSFLMGLRSIGMILAIMIVRSIGSGIQGPAVSAVYPQIVPEEHLTRIQGLNQTVGSVLMLLSPAVGGALLGSFGIVAAFFIDVVTAALAIAVMSFIRIEKIVSGKNAQSVLNDLKSGVSYTFKHPKLRLMVICYLFSYFLITPAAVLTPLMIERSFGSEVWRLTANEMIWTAGTLIGGVYVALRGKFKDKFKTVALCLVVFGVLFSLMGVVRHFWAYLLLMGLGGCFLPSMHTAETVYIQENTEPYMLGRAFSVVHLIASAAMPAAILIFGPLADVISVESIMIVSGALLAISGLFFGRKRD